MGLLLVALFWAAGLRTSQAQEPPEGTQEASEAASDAPAEAASRTSVKLSQQVINPASLAWQLQLEEFAIARTSDADGFAQNFRVRAIVPLERGLLLPYPQLIRAIFFLNTAPGGPTGFGDITLNQFWVFVKEKWGEFGAGWNLTMPTSAPRELGSQQWQVGPAFTMTFTDLGNWQMYWIWQNFFAVSGLDAHGQRMFTVLQPNVFYAWSNGLYAGTEPLWQLDYRTGELALPMNLRVGYVWSGKLKYNAYVEPEVMAYRSPGYRYNRNEFGVRVGFRFYLPM